jgi:hypothetical protein
MTPRPDLAPQWAYIPQKLSGMSVSGQSNYFLCRGKGFSPSIRSTYLASATQSAANRAAASWQVPGLSRGVAGRGAWPARRSIKSFVYNDPAELERADDLVVQRPIAGKNHAD